MSKPWQPGDSIFVEFSDCTAEPRTEADLQALMMDIRAAAEKHDFKVKTYGQRQGFTDHLNGIADLMGAPIPDV